MLTFVFGEVAPFMLLCLLFLLPGCCPLLS